MPAIAVFPGQGSQAVGMGKPLAEGSAAARAVFEEVDEALGRKLSKLAFEGPYDELTLTANAQPALMACSIAAVRAVEEACGKPYADFARVSAGHSLGEYSALVAAGALSLTDAAKLLRLRGEAMQAAVPVGQGAMAAVLNTPVGKVEEVAREASREGEPCEIANDNSAAQVVISGAKAAVDRALEIAKGKNIKRCVALPVSAPFHCSLMAPAAETLAPALAKARFAEPNVPVIANVTVCPESDPDRIRELLKEQVTGRVRWRETVERLGAEELDLQIEFGSGKVLTGLAKRAMPGVRLLGVQNHEEALAAAEALA